MKLRFATWSAVSTKDQAKKISLKVQLEKCLEAGSSRSWAHVRDYVVPGQSRTNYISLNVAEKHIPELHDLLEAAYRGEFDVLVVYDLNRFRSLMVQVFDALCDCNVQMFVLSQPREPFPTSEYSEARKREMRMNVSLNEILSNNETSQIQIHYRDKMPKRITDKGLHAGLGLPPYGYRKPPGRELDRQAVLIQDPAQVAIIRQIVDLFFTGCSLTAIADRLNHQRIPSPRGKRWWYPQIRYILSNPYYAGVVGFGMTHWTRNRRDGTKKRHRGTPITNTGRHLPLWDITTHYRILAELERRGQAHPGIKTRQLSRLLRCTCGCVLWAQIDQKRYKRWYCSSLKSGHSAIPDKDALIRLSAAIIYDVEHLSDLSLPSPTDARPGLMSEIKELRARKKRWMDLYEDGSLSRIELTERIDPLNVRIANKEKELLHAEQSLAQSAHTRSTLEQLRSSVGTLPDYIQHGTHVEVNAYLHSLLSAVIVQADKSVKLVWK